MLRKIECVDIMKKRVNSIYVNKKTAAPSLKPSHLAKGKDNAIRKTAKNYETLAEEGARFVAEMNTPIFHEIEIESTKKQHHQHKTSKRTNVGIITDSPASRQSQRAPGKGLDKMERNRCGKSMAKPLPKKGKSNFQTKSEYMSKTGTR